MYKLLSFTIFLIAGIPLFTLGIVVSFARVNGQPFHFFILNLAQTLRRPPLRVWNKELNNGELKDLMGRLPPPPTVPEKRKEAPATSRLTELTLVVNTGGVYKPEEDIPYVT